jgi:exosortase F-associated protein
MLQGNQNRRWQIALTLFLVGLLVAVRTFESQWFYDPFTAYFKSEYTSLLYPDYNGGLLFMHWIFRYAINAAISLAILYVIFKDASIIRFSSILYGLFLILLLIGMFFLLYYGNENQKMTLFYVRRFLIQPLFLLLFIPAFFYQKKSS